MRGVLLILTAACALYCVHVAERVTDHALNTINRTLEIQHGNASGW